MPNVLFDCVPVPPLDSEMGWTSDFLSKTNLLLYHNEKDCVCFRLLWILLNTSHGLNIQKSHTQELGAGPCIELLDTDRRRNRWNRWTF